MIRQCSLWVMISSTDHAMMCRALQQAARAARLDEVPVGAVVYRDGQALAEAHNQCESTNDPTAHAEILVVRQAAQRLGSWRLDGCSIAVTLEPCPMCVGALINARLDRLVYGARDPKMGCVHTLYQLAGDPRFNHRVEVVEGVLVQECGRVLSDFFQALRGRRPDSPDEG